MTALLLSALLMHLRLALSARQFPVPPVPAPVVVMTYVTMTYTVQDTGLTESPSSNVVVVPYAVGDVLRARPVPAATP